MHPRSSHRDTDTSRQSSPHQSALNKTHTRKSRVQGAIRGDSAHACSSCWIGCTNLWCRSALPHKSVEANKAAVDQLWLFSDSLPST
jgi:hypothetical protein